MCTHTHTHKLKIVLFIDWEGDDTVTIFLLVPQTAVSYGKVKKQNVKSLFLFPGIAS